MKQALLIGTAPPLSDFVYVDKPPYDAVVIGSLTLGQLLHFRDERVLSALAVGMGVYLYTPGLPESPGNRALSAALANAQRELKSWGILFTDGTRRHWVTGAEAQILRRQGLRPAPGAMLTPLAKEIFDR